MIRTFWQYRECNVAMTFVVEKNGKALLCLAEASASAFLC